MTENENIVLVYCETEDEGILPVSLEALGIGRKLCNDIGGKLSALIIGSNALAAGEELRHYGVDYIHIADNPALETYQPEYYLTVFQNVYEAKKPKTCLLTRKYNVLELPKASGCPDMTTCFIFATR